jgi:hypothetical protein
LRASIATAADHAGEPERLGPTEIAGVELGHVEMPFTTDSR